MVAALPCRVMLLSYSISRLGYAVNQRHHSTLNTLHASRRHGGAVAALVLLAAAAVAGVVAAELARGLGRAGGGGGVGAVAVGDVGLHGDARGGGPGGRRGGGELDV